MSIRQHISSQKLLDGFKWDFVPKAYNEICDNLILVLIGPT
jgi:hypothetical protein